MTVVWAQDAFSHGVRFWFQAKKIELIPIPSRKNVVHVLILIPDFFYWFLFQGLKLKLILIPRERVSSQVVHITFIAPSWFLLGSSVFARRNDSLYQRIWDTYD